MKLYLLLLLAPLHLVAQTPSRQGLKEYTLLHKGDTIRFYTNDTGKVRKTKLFLFLQGTGAFPMVNTDDSGRCCMNNYPKQLMRTFPAEYAFIYIQKIGMPYYVDKAKYDITQRFIERNNVQDRAEVAAAVLGYLLRNVYPRVDVVAVLGHSEGARVLARLTTMTTRITHLCFAGVSGFSHLYDQLLLTRRKVHKGELTSVQAEERITTLHSGVKAVMKDTASTTKYLDGDTYKWWYYEVNRPPVEDLIHVQVPMLMIIGGSDEKVPVEGSDFIKTEFERLNKTNLDYRIVHNADHSFQERLPDGSRKDRWGELFTNFLHFIEERPRH